MNMKHFFAITILFILTLTIGCSNIAAEYGSADVLSENAETTETAIRLSIDEKLSRSAMPNVSLSDISYIALTYKSGDSTGDAVTTAGWWQSIEEMKNAAIPFQTGTYTFTLNCSSASMTFSDQKTATIGTGTNSLVFTPKMEIAAGENFYGKGNLSVSIRYDSENVQAVTAGLYTLDGYRVAGFSNETLAIEGGGNSTYSKTNVPSGNYLLIFNFYADTSKKLLLSAYREYCSIINGKTSSSECVVEQMAHLYTIEYKRNGGAFTGGFTAPGSYTRQSATIELPSNDDDLNIYRQGYTFDGWYNNADFTGYRITDIPRGSTGNVTLYAKWLQNATITFNTNSSTATIITSTQEVQRGVEAALMTANDLGLSDTKNRFLGWADKSTAGQPDYTDGGAITVAANKTIYAVWSVATINPESAADTKDSDGDGISDWDEIHTYFTDPASKDTDGDGWSDGAELPLYNKTTNSFSPLIADTPKLDIRMTSKPIIKYIYQLTQSESDSVTIAENDGVVSSQSNTSANTKTHTETHGWSFEANWSYTWAAAKSGATFGFKGGYNGNVSNGDSYTYSKTASESWSKSWSKGETSTKVNGKNITGASLVIPVKFKNPSNIAYTVETATVALYRIPNNSNAGRVLVANLNLPSDKQFTIPPGGESGEFLLGTEIKNLESAEQLLKYSIGFEIETSGYKVTLQKEGVYANDFTESLTEVRAKTAALYIDWGPASGKNAETYHVSVKNNYNAMAMNIDELYTEPSLEDIFQKILNYKKGTDYKLNDNGCLTSIFSKVNQSSAKDGAWFICHKYTSAGSRLGKIYGPHNSADGWKLSDIKLNAGDEISVIYSIDTDGDGVPLNEELVYGTSDEKQDTDGDGLTDKEEIYGWYKDGIGLDDKYSENNKVYTNPLLTDSDGDDLFDYSEDSTKRDNDPMIPKRKDDPTIGICKYKTSSEGTYKEFTFDGTSKTFNGLEESIYLDIQPKYAFGTIKYKTSSDGLYAPLDDTVNIGLNVGANTIYILSTAPDGTTTREYTITVNSVFRKMNKFKVTNEQYNAGNISLTWDTYSDERAKASDGGYILYCKKGDVTKSLSLSDIAGALTTTTGLKKSNEFCIALDSTKLSGGSYSFELASVTQYTVYLFAYAHKSTEATFKSEALARQVFTTQKTPKAVFKFFAHFIKGDNEHDAGDAGEYKWEFSDNGGYIGLNDLSRSKLVDLEDGWVFSFGDNDSHGSETTKFGDRTKKFEKVIERGTDISFKVEWKAWEDDTTNTDYLGKVTANFKYSAEQDTWKCSWSAGGGDGDKAYSRSNDKSVGARGRTSNMKWELANPSKGEISFHCDMAWDEEEYVEETE